MTLTKLRIVHPRGYVEFPADQESAATAYRDANYPGCDIVTVMEEIEEPSE